ncbi:RagB/SusD family nutrient uptake outer membrane protein [Algoriphagus vanfongensis]|uniref:RagB/SusD family nutrient uptake outer membrane protein n=1 Tax=Algoriphagus vanfongensis TaxID=426371 RepID=UPI00042905FD|nr:RagB/SusD family nutrient uptake outer membrane protein [Algoriphagus vanfongensis]
MKFQHQLIYIAGFLALVSCSDLLEENPKTVAVENFYNTAEEVEAAVNAIYSPLRSTRAEQIVILDTHTDWGYGRGSRAQYNDFAGLNATNTNTAGSRWDSFYLAIRNANLVIKNAPSGTDISQDDIAYYTAEAKFLRAMAYFDLVRNWAGVPMRTENTMEEIDLPRSSEEEIYQLIIDDLIFAEANLPEVAKNQGRPTLYAAKTMLADVYMHRGNYELASSKSKEVIDAEAFSLVPVSSIEDFQQNIYGADLLNSSEEVFYLKYAREPGQGNYILWILNHPSTGYFSFGGAYAHYADAQDPFYQEWDDADIRKSMWDQVDFGLGATTIVSNKYIDPDAISQSGAGNDLPIYRYAETLLLFAESDARAKGAPTAEAIEALNQVHRRAYGMNPTASSEIDLSFESGDLEAFIDAVLQEKAYEFIFEGKRWYDLKRTGKAAETILEYRGKTIAEAHYLWPIPQQEINFNGAINPETDQNPGY